MVLADSRFHQSMEQKPSVMADILRFLGQLLAPSVLLMAAMVMAFMARGDAVPLLGILSFNGMSPDAGSWFTMGHVWIFALFMLVNLSGRRDGAAVATGSLVVAAVGAAGVWAYATYGAAHVVLSADAIAALGNQTMVLAVALSVIVGLLVDIVVFDLVRGRPWWKAPLMAPLFGGAAFVVLFHALAGNALAGAYMDRVTTHMVLVVAATLLMVLVYHLLRSVIRPRAGYGGA